MPQNILLHALNREARKYEGFLESILNSFSFLCTDLKKSQQQRSNTLSQENWITFTNEDTWKRRRTLEYSFDIFINPSSLPVFPNHPVHSSWKAYEFSIRCITFDDSIHGTHDTRGKSISVTEVNI